MNEEKEWIFTFGSDHAHPGYYVRIKGSYYEARQKMFGKYGRYWAFQYSAAEWDEMEKDPNRDWPMERQLEVIE